MGKVECDGASACGLEPRKVSPELDIKRRVEINANMCSPL